MVTVDITADVNGADETGCIWTLVARSFVAGDSDAPAVAEVVEVVEKPAGTVVHLRLVPGLIEDYEALIRRAVKPPERSSATP